MNFIKLNNDECGIAALSYWIAIYVGDNAPVDELRFILDAFITETVLKRSLFAICP